MTSRTLRRRLALFFVPVGVVTLVGVLIATIAGFRLQAAQARLTDELFRAYSLSAELNEAVLDQEAGFRGYATTREAHFLGRFRAARAREAEISRELAVAEKGVPGLAARRAEVQRRSDQWRASTIDRVAPADSPAAVVAGALQEGERAFPSVRAAVVAYQDALLRERAGALADLEHAGRLLFLVMGLSVLVLVLAAVVLWFAMRRSVIEPLERLGAEVDRVHAGELSHEVAVTAAPIEITTLAEQIDRMRLRIYEEYALVLQARQAATEAHRLVEEQAQDLQRSNAELEQFAYVASHDLQEPLRKVASFCQLLERRYRDQLDERGVQYIDFAVDGAKRMQQLINDLLAFSRVGRMTNEFVPVALDDILGQALRQLALATDEAAAEITSDPLPTVLGDSSLLVQLFQNLIGNAVKFRSGQPPRVHIGVRRSDDHWEFCCTDNGIGIEPQYAEKIFVIFQRLHGREAYGGTGIGLALCRKIVEHHNGTMWLDTSQGGSGAGTTIRWTLPVAVAEPDVRMPEERERNLSDESVPSHPAGRGVAGGGRSG